MPMTEEISALAARIDTAWRGADYDDTAFVDIAATGLDRHMDLDFAGLAHGICGGAALPAQRRADQGFGQPSLTLYQDDRFLIEALCWHVGTPAIHQHAFSGAFRILTGRSVHSRYSFARSQDIGGVTLGVLRLQSVALLDRRSVVRIPRGSGLIHAAFHLDSPSMTLVVRTHQGTEPEPTYLPPGVAYDSSARSHVLHKRLQLLDTLNRTHHPSYLDCVHAATWGADVYDGMAIVMRAASHQMDEATFQALAGCLTERHGPRATQIVRALHEERRRIRLIRLRNGASDPELRFFLACLLSFSERAPLLEAMAQFSGDAATARARVADGVSDLLGGDADRRIITRTGARALLDGVAPPTFPTWAARAWDRALTGVERSHLQQFYEQLCAHPLLRPLVSEGSAPQEK